MAKSHIGLIGLAVMGQNLALNIAEKGFRISVFNRTASKVDATVKRAQEEGGLPVIGHTTLESFIQSLELPRKIIILVKAGSSVDEILDQIIPFLAKNDIIIDGGNEWYELTEARCKRLEKHQVHYIGLGISGGESGARHGPALMPGGSFYAYSQIEPILQSISAKYSLEPCVHFIGEGGSGHYVKMVHNGIEYAEMEMIAEVYFMLKYLGNFQNSEISEIFRKWNESTELKSYLIEITSHIFAQKDDVNSTQHLIDSILDVAGSKGTGMWVVQQSACRGVPCPAIQAALNARALSTFKNIRCAAYNKYKSLIFIREARPDVDFIDNLKNALYVAKICAYAQGCMLLLKVSKDQNWNLNMEKILKGWRNGCIIRSTLLDEMRLAFAEEPGLTNLLLSQRFFNHIQSKFETFKKVVIDGLQANVPITAFSSCLMYMTSLSAERLPMNLIQAQRDYFGAHTYERIDKPGNFHTIWNDK